MPELVIRALGRPAPQGSKETGTGGALRESSAYLPAWRQAVKLAAWDACRLAGIAPTALPIFPAGTPVYLHVCAFIVTDDQCRAEGSVYPIGRPDVDKLLRAVLDALGGTRGSARLYAEDSQVISVDGLCKVRAAIDMPPGAHIIISDRPDRPQ